MKFEIIERVPENEMYKIRIDDKEYTCPACLIESLIMAVDESMKKQNKYDLTQVHFTGWWVRKNARKIIADPLLKPTDEDYENYLKDPEVIAFFA